MSDRRSATKKKLPAMSTARPPVGLVRVPMATGQQLPLVRIFNAREPGVVVRTYPVHAGPRSIARPKRRDA